MQRLEAFTKPRDATNGDALVTGTHYLAVVDGATPAQLTQTQRPEHITRPT